MKRHSNVLAGADERSLNHTDHSLPVIHAF